MTSFPSPFIETISAPRSKYAVSGALQTEAPQFLNHLIDTLFPHFGPNREKARSETERRLVESEKFLSRLLGYLREGGYTVDTNIISKFMGELPSLHSLLLLDAEAIYKGDPAAASIDEVIACYPGFFAITSYRFAHALHLLKVPLLPRILTETAHQKTGIDIHPGAEIGKSFCIDHGTGVVIGETSVIKNNVRMYQGVTLGGLAISKDMANKKRHPTIEDNVIIYANATILGGATTVGANSVIGGSVWLTESVSPGSTVYHKGDIVVRSGVPK